MEGHSFDEFLFLHNSIWLLKLLQKHNAKEMSKMRLEMFCFELNVKVEYRRSAHDNDLLDDLNASTGLTPS